MFKALRFVAMLMLLVIGAVGTAYAQEEQKGPTPVCTARQVYENGALLVSVTALDDYGKPLSGDLCRNYGYRIGDPVTLDIAFLYKPGPGVAINTDNLVKGKFDPKNGTDFAMAGPVIQTPPMDQGNGYVAVVVRVKVLSWVYKEAPQNFIVFNSVFLYSTEGLPDGTPNWKPAMTPDYVITTSPTAASISKDLDESDTGLQPPPKLTYSDPMRYTAYGILGLVALTLAWWFWRYLNPPKVKPAHALAWAVFDQVRKESVNGLSYGNAQRVAAHLRRYLKVEAITDEKEMHDALLAFFEKDKERYDLTRVGEEAFAQLDAVLYEPAFAGVAVVMPKAQVNELFERIERLVPRP
jgi:hypothetical protein